MTFVKIQLGDLVFDRVEKVDGKVSFINYQDKTAKVEVITNQNKETGERTTKLVESKLFNLVVIEAKKQKKSKFPLKVKIKYFNKDITKVEKISKGDWIDLRSAITIELKQGESALIPLGVGMKLPDGYEAYVLPRSSTHKNYKVLQTNSKGVIDNSYSGNDDEWKLSVYATDDTVINFNERVCQFRIERKMPELEFDEVENLDEVSRGGFGSTGVN